ncbi:MAG TPA: hypothetical protein VK116_13395 [Planctomycetota bacterium]|nr:hypothetical protein [Planctomycetota bacterium]
MLGKRHEREESDTVRRASGEEPFPDSTRTREENLALETQSEQAQVADRPEELPPHGERSERKGTAPDPVLATKEHESDLPGVVGDEGGGGISGGGQASERSGAWTPKRPMLRPSIRPWLRREQRR